MSSKAAILRGDVRWPTLAEPVGSSPGYRRPVVVASADSFNASAINTVVVAAISSNLDRERAPGNVAVHGDRSRLRKDSVVKVSQILTLDKRHLDDRVTTLDDATMSQIESGLRLVLDLS